MAQTMEAEIEEAQRQIRRSAAIIQDTLHDLTTLQRTHNRSPVASNAALVPTDVSSIPSIEQRPTRSTVSSSNAMDPGHDVIVISSENSTPAPSFSLSTPTPSSPIPSPLSRGPRALDSTLAVLSADLRSMTQSFRERVSEFDELRRAIAQYTQERQNRVTERARSRSPPPDTMLISPIMRLEDSPSTPSNRADDVPGASAPRRFNSRIRTMRGDSQSMLDRRSSLLRQRTTSDSETSLGLLVAARATSSPTARASVADTPTLLPATISASVRSAPPRPPTAPVLDVMLDDRSDTRHIPSNITSRIIRLAQEIQQEGVRITQQAESLRTWINGRNAQLEALRPSATAPQTRRTALRSPVATNTLTSPSENDSLSVFPLLTAPIDRPRPGEPDPRPRERNTGALSLPRRAPETSIRARYVRQSAPIGSIARGERSLEAVESRPLIGERATDGPLSPPSRTIAPAGIQRGVEGSVTTLSAAFGLARDNGIRDDVVRMGRPPPRTQTEDDSDDDVEFASSRRYRVRRRYNADGEEEVFRISQGLQTYPASPPNWRALSWEDDSGEEDSWMDALSRLDSMSRRSGVTPREPRTNWWELPQMSRTTLPTEQPSYPVNLARRSTRGWPRLYAEEEASTSDSEVLAQYERGLTAMRTRAQALISANPSPRTLGGAALPPPPPTTRPQFVPTTQAPGSLWNDSSVRVRLRTTAAHVNSDVQMSSAVERHAAFVRGALDAARPLGRDRNGGGAWPHRARDEAFSERPMWGSPAPFLPSPLPVPVVNKKVALETNGRKRVARSTVPGACAGR